MEEMKKLKKRFDELQERLDSIEKTIPLAHELVHLSERLNIPLNLYQNQLKQLIILNGIKERVPEVEKDDISRIIIQALLEKPGINISQITAKARSLRGRASRRIIAGRLKNLEALMIVEHETGQNNEKVYTLRRRKSP
jgi:DNA-binding HxlR family transcriptional regulator